MIHLPYKIQKTGAMYQVVATSSGRVQYSSLKRASCAQWITTNTH